MQLSWQNIMVYNSPCSKVRCECYAEDGTKISEHVLEAGGECLGLQIPMGVYHTTRCLEPDSVIFEAKDRASEDFGDCGCAAWACGGGVLFFGGAC